MFRFSWIIWIALALLIPACDMEEYPAPEGDGLPEILVYSGMTMIQPLMELSALFEERENCRVKISYGGSGHLFKSVQVNQVGDIFFPGVETYVDYLRKQGTVSDTVQVGYNVAGLFVQPGNPQQITSDLDALLSPRLKIVISSAEASAIGLETKAILDKSGIYQDVLDNALFLTTDSKGLTKALRNKDADLVINWKSVGFWPENRETMLYVPLDDIAERRPLVMGLLKYSEHPQLAEKLMQFASSEKGRSIFRKYGFLD